MVTVIEGDVSSILDSTPAFVYNCTDSKQTRSEKGIYLYQPVHGPTTIPLRMLRSGVLSGSVPTIELELNRFTEGLL